MSRGFLVLHKTNRVRRPPTSHPEDSGSTRQRMAHTVRCLFMKSSCNNHKRRSSMFHRAKTICLPGLLSVRFCLRFMDFVGVLIYDVVVRCCCEFFSRPFIKPSFASKPQNMVDESLGSLFFPRLPYLGQARPRRRIIRRPGTALLRRPGPVQRVRPVSRVVKRYRHAQTLSRRRSR